jgi:hypothetical protein
MATLDEKKASAKLAAEALYLAVETRKRAGVLMSFTELKEFIAGVSEEQTTTEYTPPTNDTEKSPEREKKNR